MLEPIGHEPLSFTASILPVVLALILVLNFYLTSLVWYFLRFDVLKVAIVGLTLAMVTTIRKVRQYNFTSNSSVINRL